VLGGAVASKEQVINGPLVLIACTKTFCQWPIDGVFGLLVMHLSSRGIIISVSVLIDIDPVFDAEAKGRGAW